MATELLHSVTLVDGQVVVPEPLLKAWAGEPREDLQQLRQLTFH